MARLTLVSEVIWTQAGGLRVVTLSLWRSLFAEFHPNEGNMGRISAMTSVRKCKFSLFANIRVLVSVRVLSGRDVPKILDNRERSNLPVNPDFSLKINGNCGYTQTDGALTVPFTLCKLVDKHRVKFNTFLPFHAGLPYNAAGDPADAKR